MTKIYTLGYEKRNIEEYVQLLKELEVKVLVDVREVAWSYKRDFCKTKFSGALADADIKYLHFKELGNPKTLRNSGKTAVEILENYQSYLEDTESGISSLMNVVKDADENDVNICLMCFERSHSSCHRSIITEHIEKSFNVENIFHV